MKKFTPDKDRENEALWGSKDGFQGRPAIITPGKK